MAYNPFDLDPETRSALGLDALATPTGDWDPRAAPVASQRQPLGLDALQRLSSQTSAFPSPAAPFQSPESRAPDYDPMAAFETKRSQLDDARRQLDARTAGDFEAGLKSGWESTKGLGALAASALGQKASELTDGAIGNDLQKWGYEKYKQTEEAAAPYQQGRPTKMEDIAGVGSAVDWFQYQLGNVIPSLAESVAAGLIGAGVGTLSAPGGGTIGGAMAGAVGKAGLKKILENKVKEQVLRGVAKNVAEKRVGQMVAAGVGTFVAGYQMGLGDVYGETLDETGKGNATLAMLFALPYAGIEAITDLTLAGKILKGKPGAKAVTNLAKALALGGRVAKAAGEGAILEGGQEGAQEAVNILAGLNEGKTYDTGEVISRIGNAMAAGAIAGGVIGSAGARQDPNAGKSDVDLLLDRAHDTGPIPGWQDRAALTDAVINPQVDDVTRARALSAVESRLMQQDPLYARLWREASVRSLADRRPIQEVLAELQGTIQQRQQAAQKAIEDQASATQRIVGDPNAGLSDLGTPEPVGPLEEARRTLQSGAIDEQRSPAPTPAPTQSPADVVQVAQSGQDMAQPPISQAQSEAPTPLIENEIPPPPIPEEVLRRWSEQAAQERAAREANAVPTQPTPTTPDAPLGREAAGDPAALAEGAAGRGAGEATPVPAADDARTLADATSTGASPVTGTEGAARGDQGSVGASTPDAEAQSQAQTFSDLEGGVTADMVASFVSAYRDPRSGVRDPKGYLTGRIGRGAVNKVPQSTLDTMLRLARGETDAPTQDGDRATPTSSEAAAQTAQAQQEPVEVPGKATPTPAPMPVEQDQGPGDAAGQGVPAGEAEAQAPDAGVDKNSAVDRLRELNSIHPAARTDANHAEITKLRDQIGVDVVATLDAGGSFADAGITFGPDGTRGPGNKPRLREIYRDGVEIGWFEGKLSKGKIKRALLNRTKQQETKPNGLQEEGQGRQEAADVVPQKYAGRSKSWRAGYLNDEAAKPEKGRPLRHWEAGRRQAEKDAQSNRGVTSEHLPPNPRQPSPVAEEAKADNHSKTVAGQGHKETQGKAVSDKDMPSAEEGGVPSSVLGGAVNTTGDVSQNGNGASQQNAFNEKIRNLLSDDKKRQQQAKEIGIRSSKILKEFQIYPNDIGLYDIGVGSELGKRILSWANGEIDAPYRIYGNTQGEPIDLKGAKEKPDLVVAGKRANKLTQETGNLVVPAYIEDKHGIPLYRFWIELPSALLTESSSSYDSVIWDSISRDSRITVSTHGMNKNLIDDYVNRDKKRFQDWLDKTRENDNQDATQVPTGANPAQDAQPVANDTVTGQPSVDRPGQPQGAEKTGETETQTPADQYARERYPNQPELDGQPPSMIDSSLMNILEEATDGAHLISMLRGYVQPRLMPLVEALEETGTLGDIKIDTKTGMTFGAIGQVFHERKGKGPIKVTSRLNPVAIANYGISLNDAGVMTEVVIHELLHAAVLLRNNGTLRELVKRGDAAAQRMETLRAQLQRYASDNKNTLTAEQSHAAREATANVDEMFAWGLSNPDVQRVLEKIPAMRKRTAWDKFVIIVRQLLGLQASMDSALSEVLQTGAELLRGMRPTTPENSSAVGAADQSPINDATAQPVTTPTTPPVTAADATSGETGVTLPYQHPDGGIIASGERKYLDLMKTVGNLPGIKEKFDDKGNYIGPKYVIVPKGEKYGGWYEADTFDEAVGVLNKDSERRAKNRAKAEKERNKYRDWDVQKLIDGIKEAIDRGDSFEKALEINRVSAHKNGTIKSAGSQAGTLKGLRDSGIKTLDDLRRAVINNATAQPVTENQTQEPVQTGDGQRQSARPLDDGEIIPIEDDPRLQDANNLQRVRDLSLVSGWQEEGGRIIRNAKGEVVGRTKWLPLRDWWFDRPDGVTKKVVDSAVAKFDRGEPLNKKERAALRFLTDIATTEDLGPTYADLEAEAPNSVDKQRAAEIEARAESLDETELDDLKERAAMRADGLSHTQYLNILEELVNDAIKSRAPSTVATGEGAAGPGEGAFSLTGETEAEIRARETAAEQRAQQEADALAAEEAKRAADAQVDTFSLTPDGGSAQTRAAEQAEQGNLFDEPAAPKAESLLETTKASIDQWREMRTGHPAFATAFEKDVGGTIVYSDETRQIALIEGYSTLHGRPVYGAIKGNQRTNVDIESYTGPGFTEDEKADLIAAKKRAMEIDATLAAENPDGPFKNGERFAASPNTPVWASEAARYWLGLLGIDRRVYLTTTEDAKGAELFGPYAAVRSAAVDSNEAGSTRELSLTTGKDFYIAIDISGPRTSAKLETLAHEIGHILEKTEWDSASTKIKNAIIKDYNDWIEKAKNTKAKEWPAELRAHTTGKLANINVRDDTMVADLPAYWHSFSEYFADQVSRWATTTDKPLSVVDHFFKRIADGIRRLMRAVTGKRFVPAKSMQRYLDALASKSLPYGMQQKADPTASGEPRFSLSATRTQATWLSVADLQSRLDAITAKLKGLRIPVRVVQGEADLTAAERAKLAETRKTKPSAYPQAVYRGNEIIVIADNVAGPKDAFTQLWHEGGHYSNRQIFGPTYDSVLDQIIADRGADVELYAKARGLDMTSLEQRREAADEMLAHMAERNDKADRPFLERVYQAIRAMLRKLGIRLRFSNSDLREILAAQKRYLETGDARVALRTRGRFGGDSNTDTNPDIRFSLADIRSVRDAADLVQEKFADWKGRDPSVQNVSKWFRSVGTPRALAKLHPETFGRAYEAFTGFSDHVTTHALQAQQLAPSWVADMEGGIKKAWQSAQRVRRAMSKDRLASVVKAINETTRVYKHRMSEAELAANGLDAEQQGVYNQYFNALHHSLDQATQTLQAKVLRGLLSQLYGFMPKKARRARVEREATSILDQDIRTSTENARELLRPIQEAATQRRDEARFGLKDATQELKDAKKAKDDVRITQAEDAVTKAQEQVAAAQKALDRIMQTERSIVGMRDRVSQLKAEGYSPLMRFGRFTMTVYQPVLDEYGEPVMKDGKPQMDVVYHGQYATEAEMRAAKRQVEAALKDDQEIVTGTRNEEAYRLFAGINMDTLALFADQLDSADLEPADRAQIDLLREYIRLGMADQSALKRQLERGTYIDEYGDEIEGIPGFSEDAQRVLTSYILSNARLAAANLYSAPMRNAIDEIPKTQGDLAQYATRLMTYLQDPREEFAGARSFLFYWYLGGAVSSAVTNLTQVPMIAVPYFTQFPEFKASMVTQAYKITAAGKGKGELADTTELGQAYLRAEQEGTIAPQEIHAMMAASQGGQMTGGAFQRLLRNPNAQFGLQVLSSLFSRAEQINRSVSFIAGYKIAQAKGLKGDAAFRFADEAVKDTQFVYRRENRPEWGRGIGAPLMVFKSYTINLVEMLVFHLPPKQKAVALAALFLVAGLGGLPGEEDLEDVIDTIMQMVFGKNWHTREELKDAATAFLGETFGEAVMKGIPAGFTPFDFSRSLGAGNLIPGTALLKPSAMNKTRELANVAGPLAGVVQDVGRAVESAGRGEYAQAGLNLMPRFVKNLHAGMGALDGTYDDRAGMPQMELNAMESIGKALGFQPSRLARFNEAKYGLLERENFNTKREDAILDKMARGRAFGKPELVREARAELDAWNQRNPNDPIKYKRSQITRRVRALKMSGDARFLKSLSPERRKEAAEALGL